MFSSCLCISQCITAVIVRCNLSTETPASEWSAG